MSRALIITKAGRIRYSKDTDGDNIHENSRGKPLTCYINIENDLTLVEVRKVPPLPFRTTTSPSSDRRAPDSSSKDPTPASTP